MADQLIINGVEVDMGDSGVYLEYKSNIVSSDLGKINSNFSYTIKLPKTAKNLSVFKIVEPSSNAKTYFTLMQSMLLRDGVPLITDAMVQLTGIDQYINIVLIFGVGTQLKALIKDDKKLNELKSNDFVMWERKGGVMANYGFVLEDLNAWYHPVVSVTDILNYIAEDYNVGFVYPTDAFERFAVPCLKRKGFNFTPNKTLTITYTFPKRITAEEEQLGVLLFTADNINAESDGFFFDKVYGHRGSDYYDYSLLRPALVDTRILLSGHIEVTYQSNLIADTEVYLSLVYCGRKGGGEIKEDEQGLFRPIEFRRQGNMTTAVFEFGEHRTDWVKPIRYKDSNDNLLTYEGNYFAFCLPPKIFSSANDGMPASGVVYIQQVETKANTVDYGKELYKGTTLSNSEGKYPFAPNLPSMTVLQFIKSICELEGLYIKVQDNTIEFDYKDSALNTTQKIKGAKIEQSMQFTADDIAKSNIFKYKEGKLLSSSIVSEKAFGDTSKVYLESALTEPAISASGWVSFPLYDYDVKDGQYEQKFTESDNAYVLKRTTLAGSDYLTIEGLRWSDILANRYNLISRVIKNATNIKKTFYVSPYDFKHIQISNILHDDGVLYMIESISTKRGNIAEFKLVKI